MEEEARIKSMEWNVDAAYKGPAVRQHWSPMPLIAS